MYAASSFALARLHGDGQHLMISGQRLDRRLFSAADGTPRCPKVNQQWLTAITFQFSTGEPSSNRAPTHRRCPLAASRVRYQFTPNKIATIKHASINHLAQRPGLVCAPDLEADGLIAHRARCEERPCVPWRQRPNPFTITAAVDSTPESMFTCSQPLIFFSVNQPVAAGHPLSP